MLTVADLMTREPDTVDPRTTLREVLQLMNVDGCRHLPVLDGEVLVGIITDRDVRLAIDAPVLAGEGEPDRYEMLETLRAGEFMTEDPTTVAPDTPAGEAADLLSLYKYGGLPVLGADGRLAGVVTTVDFLRWFAGRESG